MAWAVKDLLRRVQMRYKRTRELAEVKEGFEDQLKRLETDHVEIGMVHYVDSMADWELVKQGEVMQYAQQLKAAGVIGSIGLSSHNPAVASVMSGAKTIEELKSSVAYENAPQHEKDYAEAFAQFPKISWKGHCMYCGHCAPCPKGIDVASVTKFLNLTIAQGQVPETVREHYEVLEHKAGECVACGACEKRCPFEVPVIENMHKAAETFGK